ncbi:hypothetical protein [Desmospora profundinema]|uniref:Membrane protein YgcG n=1 Tax=Desmospora profundinema TaxID=1571184 RepID=A0ABU1IPP9_9BACL|nr:hypothetical protein [Desmospora profundinema]MDR6226755.1 putative membrane protein YgcG [Desmospora profundinema]
MTAILLVVCFGLVILLFVAVTDKKKEGKHHVSSSPADTHSGSMGHSNSCGDSGSSGWFGGGGDHSCGGGDSGGGGGE